MRRLLVVVAVLLVAAVGVPAGAATADRAKPNVSFTTASGAVLFAAPSDVPPPPAEVPTRVTGRASDDVSGVKSVRVLFCGGGRVDESGGWTCGGTFTPPVDPIVDRTATLACTNSTRRSCTWSAAVPDTPGTYLAFVSATDKTGKTRSAGPIQIAVL